MKKILVMGASGGTGRAAVLRALAKGLSVRAWAYAPRELAFRHPALEVVSGDAREPELAARAVRGVDAVICALGSTQGLEPTRLCSEATAALVRAMRGAGPRRVIAVTSMGTTGKLGPVHERLLDPLLLHRIYDDKRDQERILEESELDWTIVRPGRLTDGPDRGLARAVLDGPLVGVTVSRAALARFLVDQLTSDRFHRLAPYLADPSPAWLPWHRVLTLGAA